MVNIPLKTAIVTASYASDFERFCLLCETMDEYVTGHKRHLVLVEPADVEMFRALESGNRVIIDERDLLPHWLRPYPDPSSFFRRRIWLSRRTKPLRGWHVQQLRRIGAAAVAEEDALFFCDSDVAFFRPFDCSSLWSNGNLRLFRRTNALENPDLHDQRLWSANAGEALGIPAGQVSTHDYISTLIAWRRDAVMDMCEHIKQQNGGRHWVESVAASRKFSECMIYGRYADEILGTEGHFHDDHELCHILWSGAAPSVAELEKFIRNAGSHQVALGIQSFVGVDPHRIRQLIRENAVR